MTCIKTGARIFLDAYNRVVPADIHRVGNCYVINYNVNCPHDAFPAADATHTLYTHPNDGQWHDQNNGIIVTQEWELATTVKNWEN